MMAAQEGRVAVVEALLVADANKELRDSEVSGWGVPTLVYCCDFLLFSIAA
jgi:hypothetical protein